ncbi:MAG TPA: class I SAM-dependent methyltransferase [Pyrinomonadaceae bacterium]|nr:class I SAM-dependent methyltransferase [Pyrinomonadaceae bacterium]
MRLYQLSKSAWLAAALVACAACGTSDTTRTAQAPAASPSKPSPSPVTSPSADITPADQEKLDVPYVPTPEPVVARMLEMAGVKKDDLLYDLGSGDGRIVITAAKKYGARGVGYDIDPLRIRESNENAQRAGVADRVRFVQGDLFQADLSGASVVTLYLLPEINDRLRPKLLKELKPGTRVVSHNYGMTDWEPLELAEVEVRGDTHYIYSWVIPPRADAPGK